MSSFTPQLPTQPTDMIGLTPTPSLGTPASATPEDPIQTPPPKTQDVGNILFEDYFPPLDLTHEQEESISNWLIRDLKSCARHVNGMRSTWAKYRAVYMMDYTEKFYPSLGIGADFASGLLCEKVLEGLDRLSTGIFTPRPLFTVDDRTSNVEGIDFTHRAEWFLHTLFENDLEIVKAVGLRGLFEFLLDGSMIMEADQMYEKIPQRTINTYSSPDELMTDSDKILNEADFEKAMEKLEGGELARVLVEEETITKNGLQTFIVDKVDHLVPPNVYDERDVRFRGRRMYLTENDLKLMASDGVNWYDKEKVDKVLSVRNIKRTSYSMASKGDTIAGNAEEVSISDGGPLMYDWRREEGSLAADKTMTPYKNTFAVYRTLAKYAYKTKGDEKGLIPKFCVFDIEPESRTILRARTYPHFHERKNYFHFKLGYAPKSYYGFGFGARLINEDFLESNAVDLFLDSAAMATFKPTIAIHPEHGGMVPFADGLGPGKVGYVRNMGDVKPYDISPPSDAILRHLLPLTKTRSENRTSVTSLVQGRTEETDPRSPASKAAMLISEANVGIDALIKDWNRTGWEPLAQFVWDSAPETLVYEGKTAFDDKIIFPGYAPELEEVNKITVEELRKKINWKSQAASDYLNTQLRENKFLQQFQLFSPVIEKLAAINPELYKKYFLRWMVQAAQELNIRNFKYLMPTAEELSVVAPEQMQGMMQNIMETLQPGQQPGARGKQE